MAPGVLRWMPGHGDVEECNDSWFPASRGFFFKALDQVVYVFSLNATIMLCFSCRSFEGWRGPDGVARIRQVGAWWYAPRCADGVAGSMLHGISQAFNVERSVHRPWSETWMEVLEETMSVTITKYRYTEWVKPCSSSRLGDGRGLHH